jgi:hypothetical protein
MKKTSRVAAKKKAATPTGPTVYPQMVQFTEPICLPGQNEPATKYINLEKDPTLFVQVLDHQINIQCVHIEGVMVSVPISNVRQITYKTRDGE